MYRALVTREVQANLSGGPVWLVLLSLWVYVELLNPGVVSPGG